MNYQTLSKIIQEGGLGASWAGCGSDRAAGSWGGGAAGEISELGGDQLQESPMEGGGIEPQQPLLQLVSPHSFVDRWMPTCCSMAVAKEQAVSLDPYKLYRFMSRGVLTIPQDGTMVES